MNKALLVVLFLGGCVPWTTPALSTGVDVFGVPIRLQRGLWHRCPFWLICLKRAISGLPGSINYQGHLFSQKGHLWKWILGGHYTSSVFFPPRFISWWFVQRKRRAKISTQPWGLSICFPVWVGFRVLGSLHLSPRDSDHFWSEHRPNGMGPQKWEGLIPGSTFTLGPLRPQPKPQVSSAWPETSTAGTCWARGATARAPNRWRRQRH